MVTMLPELIAVAVALLASLGEVFHLRRIRRVERLAFGPDARPRRWTWAAPPLRVAALAAAAWGFASLWLVVEPRVHNQETLEDDEYRHLVLVVDVSPSMHLKDAGPDGERTRRQRSSEILESMFNRVPTRNFKVSLIGVYTDAKALLKESKDLEVVRHIMERMPMWHAFKPGKTDLMAGIKLAGEMAKPWRPGSTYVVLLTDGDTVPAQGMPKLPPAVRELLVVGVGDSTNGMFIDGHQSRQDINTLRQVANRLKGVYHNGNEKHLPSQLVGRLAAESESEARTVWTRREWALLATVVGSAIFALLPICLHYLGTGFIGGVQERRAARAA